MALSKSKKPVKRRDGKPTRAQRRKVNQSSFKQAKRDFSLYMPPSACARYKLIIEELKGKEITSDDQIKRAVLSLIIGGLSLRWAREIVGVSHYQWHLWLHEDEDLAKQYNKAKDERSEAWADDIMEDAESANAFNAQAVRLRIDTKKWLMGKNSGRYADKVVLAGDKDNPIQTVTREMSAEESQEAYQAMKKASGA